MSRTLRRTVALALAVVLGMGAVVLATNGATATVAGQSRHCAGPVVSAEIDDASVEPPTDAVGAALAQACARKDRQQAVLSALAALLAGLAAATAAGRTGAPARPSPSAGSAVPERRVGGA